MKFKISNAAFLSIAAISVALAGCASNTSKENAMSANYKPQNTELLKSIETGDAKPVGYINPAKYIQHNLAVGDGLAGFGAVLQALPKGSAKVNTVRVLQDGPFVVAHTDYNFFGPRSALTSSVLKMGRSLNTGTTCKKRLRPIPVATPCWMARPP